MKPILTLIPKAAKTAMTAVFAALLFVSCVSDDTPDDPADGSLVKVGDAVPAFTVTLDDGSVITLGVNSNNQLVATIGGVAYTLQRVI